MSWYPLEVDNCPVKVAIHLNVLDESKIFPVDDLETVLSWGDISYGEFPPFVC